MSERSQRLWLKVPVGEVAQAEAKGAQFDTQRNSWYITDEMPEEQLENFDQWCEPQPFTHFVFTGIYTMEGKCKCPHCEKSTEIICLFTTDAAMINEGFEPWPEHTNRFNYVFGLVRGVSHAVAFELKSRFNFYMDKEKPQHQSENYLNHCKHCGGKIPVESTFNSLAPLHAEDGHFDCLQLYRLNVELPVQLSGGAGSYWKSDSTNNDDLFGVLLKAAK